jgi:hypothetical protein
MPLDLQRKRDLGKILDDAFAFYRRNFKTLLAVALVVVVPVHLIVSGVGLGWLWEGYDSPPKDVVRLSDVTDSLIGLAAQLLIVTPLVTAMTVHVVRSAAAGTPATTSASLRAALDVFGALLLAVVLVALGVGLGLLAFLIPGVILAVRWAVVPQVVVVEGLRGTEALRRSFLLTQGQGWFAFLVLLVTNILVSVLSAIAILPLEYAAEQADSQAISLAGQMLGAIIALPILAVAQTLLYYTLLVAQEAPAAAAQSAEATSPAPASPATSPQTLPGVPGTYGDGFAPPRPPEG